MSTQILKIEGMTCNGCANRVAKTLKEVPGVYDVNVSFADGTAEVMAECPIDPDFLTDAIEKQGYHAHVAP